MGLPNQVARGGGVIAAQKPLRFDSFVLLDHNTGSAASPTALGSLETALGFSSGSPDAKLQAKIDAAVAADPKVAGLPFSVIDLTQATPRYAGHKDTHPYNPASMGKMMIMLGAYQLKFDLACLAAKESIADLPKLIDRATALWPALQTPAAGATTTNLRAAKPKIDLQDHLVLIDGKKVSMKPGFDSGPCKLDQIFDPAGGVSPPKFKDDGIFYPQIWTLTYYNEQLANAQDQAANNHDPATRAAWKVRLDQLKNNFPPILADLRKRRKTDKMTWAFADQVRIMIGWSDDDTPAPLVAKMGEVPVNSPLWRSGLFRPDVGGLWLGHPYAHSTQNWRKAPVGGLPGETDGTTNDDNKTATTLALATLMAAIVRNKIVDPASCAEMRWLMTKGGPRNDFFADPTSKNGLPPGFATRSWIQDCLVQGGVAHDPIDPAKGDFGVVISKLGIVGGYNSDTAYIERKVGSRKFKYVIAVLNCPDPKTWTDMFAVAMAVDQAVMDVNAPATP